MLALIPVNGWRDYVHLVRLRDEGVAVAARMEGHAESWRRHYVRHYLYYSFAVGGRTYTGTHTVTDFEEYLTLSTFPVATYLPSDPDVNTLGKPVPEKGIVRLIVVTVILSPLALVFGVTAGKLVLRSRGCCWPAPSGLPGERT
jgi:hypothetical protein